MVDSFVTIAGISMFYVVAGACLTHDGAVRHEPTAAALADRKGGH